MDARYWKSLVVIERLCRAFGSAVAWEGLVDDACGQSH